MRPPVSEFKLRLLRQAMERLNIRETDIEERFIRSQGKGGQHINKTATCVYLRHHPTGIEVKCQQERSQSLNRFFARRLLLAKIEALIQGSLSIRQQQIQKIRRQKRRRSRRAKEKMLAGKKYRGAIKQTRRKITAPASSAE